MNLGSQTNFFGGSLFGNTKIEINNNKNDEDDIDNPSLYSPHMKQLHLENENQSTINNISNKGKLFNFNINTEPINNKININNYNIKNYNNNEEIEKEEEIKEEEEEIEGKKEEEKKEEFEKEQVSLELNKPDLLKSVDNEEYLFLINEKINNYKKQLDSSCLYKIEENKNELIQQEKKFNNMIDLINISQKVMNYIGDSIDNSERQLEDIIENQEKIILDLDNIEENLDKRIKSSQNKNEILKKNKDKNSEIKRAFKSIEDKIEKCHKLMIGNSDKLNINNNPKSLNDILERIYWKIKQDIQGKEAKIIKEIYNREKNFINEK